MYKCSQLPDFTPLIFEHVHIDLFSLAKIISNSASGLVRYYFARLNKSRYPPSPCPISVYY